MTQERHSTGTSEGVTRRWFVRGTVGAGVLALAGCIGRIDGDYEIWAMDQGTNTIYIYEPRQEPDEEHPEFVEIDTIDTEADGGLAPHLIQYSSDYEYAAVACTAGGRTLVYRTGDRELVADLETGDGTHFAGFAPGDDAIIVDVIGESKIVRIDVDLEYELFEIDDEIDIGEGIEGLTAEEGAPICHSYDQQGRSLHTLGPSYHDGGLVIVDHGTSGENGDSDEDVTFEVETAFTGEELPTNCATMPHPTAAKFYLTAGLPSDPEREGESIDAEGVGEYYVFDTDSDEIVTRGDSGGVDAHGLWFTPNEELWIANRETNDGVVVDPETDEIADEIDAFGPAQSPDPGERDAPGIVWTSPDGEYVFVTLRGPVPSGDPHAATGVTPGFSVIGTESREIVTVVEPDPIDEYDEGDIEAALAGEDDAPAIPDFHGIGVVPTEEFDGPTSPPY